MPANLTVLLIDDEDQFRFLTGMSLKNSGFEVVEAATGDEGLKLIHSVHPAVVLLDLNMPEPDGHEVCERIKKDIGLRTIPVIILTASDDLSDKLRRLKGGADDYITKYTDYQELEARIHMVIRRNQQNLDSNPLTKLPGNNVIQEVILKYIENNQPFAVAYTDLDNFKAYNDKYGFQKGDEVILMTAAVLKKASAAYDRNSGFVGHVGGDDFVVIASPDWINAICQEIICLLDSKIGDFYDEEDKNRGYIETRNRQGNYQKFPLVSISIAVVNNQNREFTALGEIVRTVTELKKYAKQKQGSCLVVDKRGA
jgi:diguanylate cyclase (GGDEF)-like protein